MVGDYVYTFGGSQQQVIVYDDLIDMNGILIKEYTSQLKRLICLIYLVYLIEVTLRY